MTQRVLQRLREIGLLPDPADGWTAERAAGGLNSTVWRVSERSTPRYTVREARPGRDLLAEARAISAASGCPGVPVLRHVEPRMLVHDFLAGEVMALDDVTERQVEALARTLACLHGHKAPGYVVWPDRTLRLGTRLDALRARIASLHKVDLEGLSELVILRDGVEAEIKRMSGRSAGWGSMEFAEIHGDLSIGNLLWTDDAVYLIDWEYARAADQAEELAYLFTEQPVLVSLMDKMLAAYVEAGGDPTAVERLTPWAAFTSVDSAIWWVVYLRGQGERIGGQRELEARIDVGFWWLGQCEKQ